MIPKYPVSVKAVIEREGKFLMIVKEREGMKEFSFPGGLVEEGESLEEALKREVMEETGLEVEPLEVFYATKNRHPKGGENVGIYYFVKVLNSNLKIGKEKDQRFLRVGYFSKDEVPEWAKKVIEAFQRFLNERRG